MGFFSFITLDTGRSIRNRFTEEGATPVTMVYPLTSLNSEYLGSNDQSNAPCALLVKRFEDNYEGYGEFGGIDFFEAFYLCNKERIKALENVTYKMHTPYDTKEPPFEAIRGLIVELYYDAEEIIDDNLDVFEDINEFLRNKEEFPHGAWVFPQFVENDNYNIPYDNFFLPPVACPEQGIFFEDEDLNFFNV